VSLYVEKMPTLASGVESVVINEIALVVSSMGRWREQTKA